MLNDYFPYYEAARALGLTIAPAEGPGLFTALIQLDGWLGGRPVFVGRTIGKHPTAVFRAGLRPSLDLGLRITRSGVAASITTLFGEAEVEVGDAPFDDAFAVRGDEPERVKALLTPRLRAAFMTCAEAPLRVDDHELTLEYSAGLFGRADDRGTIVRSLQSLVALAGEIDAARPGTPPPADVAPLLGQLAAYARERNLACAFDTPPRLVGKLGELGLWMTARRRRKNATDLEITLRFEQPLGFGFSVATARSGFETWFAGDDVQIGDAEVDRAFDIRTEAPARLVALLDAPARRTLLELGAGRVLRLDASGLQLVDDARDFNPVALPSLIERAADMMKSLSRAAHTTLTAAYR